MAVNIKERKSVDVILPMDVVSDNYSNRAEPSIKMLRTDNGNFDTNHAEKEPLMETDNTNNPKPTSGPEIDDLEPEDKVVPSSDNDEGIDDGLLPGNGSVYPRDDSDQPADPFPSFPAAPPGPGSGVPVPRNSPDVNVYQQKKTIAQGMMDLALISANANQFRYVLQTSGRHPFYYPSLIMIGLSLLLQVVVGIGLIWNSCYNIKIHNQMCMANKANNLTVSGIFLITILNVFISSFGIVENIDSRTFVDSTSVQ
ncbi:uncharacterized protein LOC107267780 [Cephus cinctus]|uniref:Uncharacterized protein LOC107267780 n=1 Tax=Cephus cinctus TaxID=211228 RepID=A0AAJ7BWA4_CEPCN|nr:uncharacterized protein LOC107267780 [Cephus cinctus]